MINDGTFEVTNNQRDLKADNKRKESAAVPVFKVEVVPSIDSNPDDLNFKWKCTSVDGRTMNVQFYFENPHAVTSNPVPEEVKITFNFPKLFMGLNG